MISAIKKVFAGFQALERIYEIIDREVPIKSV